MTAPYTSIIDIKRDFQIDSDNLEVIRDRLNEIRVNNHPDKNNGVFGNEDLKEKFYKANNAIQYIDSLKNNHSLVVVEKMTDLMKIVTELIPSNKQYSLEQNLDTKFTNAISAFRSKLFIPKISLTAITAVLTFIFFFPGQVKDNPTLSKYVNPTSSSFAILWLGALFYSGFFWIMTFYNEERSKKKLALLKVDSTQNRLFEAFTSDVEAGIFTKDKLTEFVYLHSIGNRLHRRLNELHPFSTLRRINYIFFGSEIVTMEIAQGIAELIIARAEKNNLIQKVINYSLSDSYALKNYSQQ